MNGISEYRKPRGNPSPSHRITLRKLVIMLLSATASAAVWHRTGGDVLMTLFVAPVVFGALDHWVWDDPFEIGPDEA